MDSLPSNLAIAVNAELDYLILNDGKENIIIGEFAYEKFKEEFNDYNISKK